MKKKLGARPQSPRPQDLRTNATALPAESLEAQLKSLESSLEKTLASPALYSALDFAPFLPSPPAARICSTTASTRS